MKKKIYAQAPAAAYNASTYYRIVLPLHSMAKLDLPFEIHLDPCGNNILEQDRWNSMMDSDIMMLYQSVSPGFLRLIDDLKKLPYQYHNGVKLAPPSFWMDTDDDLFNVHPLNPAFKNLGWKDHNGNVLEDGARVWIRNPVTQDPELMWSDIANEEKGIPKNIDLAANRQCLDTWRGMLQRGELITVSTPYTKEYVLREIGQEHENKILISPNCINFVEFPKIELAEHPDEVRILWQGSKTHWEDLWALREPLIRVMEKYPHAKLIIWGVDYAWLTKGIKPEQVEFLGWMDYRAYKLYLSTLGHDINLAPLKNTVFAKSRSAIKFYESAALWKPVPTLAQNFGAYGDEIIDGETGLLFDTPEEFETKLSGLIEDAMLRKRLAANAKDWVRTNRDPIVHAMTLAERLEQVRRERLDWPEYVEEKKDVPKTKRSNTRRGGNYRRGKRGNRN